nr:MAG TPA: internal virion protein C [Caudoviricetes sp.]
MALAQSLGTFENFKKHPVGGYVGSYSTPQITTEDFSQSDALINALSKGADALLDFEKQREDYRKEYGLAKAQELINSTSEKDRLELDTRTLLINAGMLNLTDNFYAMSLLEKNVGETAAKSFTRDYMHELSIHPDSYKKTRQEQLDDYHQKRKDFYNAIKEKRAFSNPLAFDLGFHDHAPLDEGAVFDSHTKWLDEQSHKEALITLSDKFKQYSLDLLHNTAADNGETLGLFKAAINEAKLQGIRPEEIAKAIDAKIHDYLLSGKSDTKSLDALKELEIGVWHTADDNFGKPMTYGQFMGTSIAPYYKAFEQENDKIFTQRKLDIRNMLEEAARTGGDQKLMDVYETKLTPKEQKEFGHLVPQISQQEKTRKESLIRQQMKGVQKAAASFRSAGNMQALIEGLKNDAVPVEKNLKDMGIDDDTAFLAVTGIIDSQSESPETVMKLLKSPQLNGIKERIKNAIEAKFSAITSISVEGAEGKAKAVRSLEYFTRQYISNPSLFQDLYGDKTAGRMNTYKSLRDIYGVDNAVIHYTEGQDRLTDPTAKEAIMDKAKDILKENRDGINMTTLGGADISVNPFFFGGTATAIKEFAAQEIAGGLPDEKVAADIEAFMKESYNVYKFYGNVCVAPKRVFDGNGTHKDGSWMGISTETYDATLDDFVYAAAGDYPISMVTVEFVPSRNVFKIHNQGSGQATYITPQMLKDAANDKERMKEKEDRGEQRERAANRRNLGEDIHPYQYDETGVNLMGGTD